MKVVLIGALIALAVALFGTRIFIQFLVRRGYGQFIRDDGPTSHHTKRGTPTMGGAVIIAGSVSGYFLAHLLSWSPPTVSGCLVMFLLVGLGLVGFADDWMKISHQRSLGLRSVQKLVLQVLVSTVFAILATRFGDKGGRTPGSFHISFVRDTWVNLAFGGTALAVVLFVLWANLIVAGTSNGVNLTDGLDGLATGVSAMVFGAYILISVWQYNQNCEYHFSNKCYQVRDPLDLAVVAACVMASCFGFLWWNATPAKIFMGDTGSLALGGALAGLAICSRTELLVVILGGLFVLETLSVILQVGSFKLRRKRIFRMAPLHHHFEMLGWEQVTVVIRFWIIAGLCVAVALGLFYAEWVVT
ncbi:MULTISPECIES: phospho-N-acetylmuramoyl-pentapeptide-transferase [Allobranchiibius]|uniref:Phospho-N-acetylmuramoyl-pentapeptide-transferase n=1 Tax=Allobranchiibius huperziae TaxID=1874116 RepID=A0A853DJC6_9MICO|nr:phospho-N-acetylmuramoyl-pentapeptide-transferase [Allobranchiibius sp. GilTou73]MBO1766949.1 phospho-N-acetylmuramoyl-pentapeptide-transferase [Allobranchiibius sp. GilTou38]NYJ75114.1 phospho-N-acetylmuramoyl-pentapeptide-transferase [Allobranchiibius huperziae]UIJ33537.1 phospho-N-acetylmuramoyl-pentapeptide-transferase [Allobranchiibius sp. GilTou73]